MRTVDARWSNVAAGLKRAKQLDRELKKEWVPRVEEARRSRHERERTAWRVRQEANRRSFEEELAAWRARYAERCRHVEDQMPVWTRAYSNERQRLKSRAGWGALSTLALLAVAAAILALVAATVWSYLIVAATVLSLALGPASLSWWRLARLRGQKPSPNHTDDPEPQPPATEPEPRPDQRDPLSLKIAQQWWDEVSYDSNARRSEATYGDEGVDDFWNYLVSRLPNNYVAVRDLLVRKALDVDVLVVGPTGIWIFEVKHWSGEITCRRGKWRRKKTWHEQGGYEVCEEEDIDSFDEQWLREQDAVEETLRRRLPQPGSLISTISGGIVFTHPEATWDIDKSCRSGWGPPKYWAKTIVNSPALPQLTPENQLRVLDALLKWAHRLDREPAAPSCSVELAQRLFSKATGNARAYVEA